MENVTESTVKTVAGPLVGRLACTTPWMMLSMGASKPATRCVRHDRVMIAEVDPDPTSGNLKRITTRVGPPEPPWPQSPGMATSDITPGIVPTEIPGFV